MSCGCKTTPDTSVNCGTIHTSGQTCDKVDTCGNSYKMSVFDWLATVPTGSPVQNLWVEIRFKNERKGFYKNTENLPLHAGSIVVVEAPSGYDIGIVSLTGELVNIQMKRKHFQPDQILKIHRIASQKDLDTWHEVRNREDSIKVEARKIARFLKLEMKITDIEFQGDGSKITFYYTAEGRVDFRQLIKEFATNFRAKVDMKQIGHRQESAKVGGIGSCGRELCCSTWLTDFRSVNTNAARYQQLSINPVKLAGQCGKLKCCLNYELDSYIDALSHFPPSNTLLDTEKGRAYCIKVDVLKSKMWFAYAENNMVWYDVHITEVKRFITLNKNGEKCPAFEDLKAQNSPMVSNDVIQENRLDRFEKKRKNNTRTKATHTAEQEKKAHPAQLNKTRRPDNGKGQKKTTWKKFSNNHRKTQNNNGQKPSDF